MINKQLKSMVGGSVLSLTTLLLLAPHAWCQRATVNIEPEEKKIELKMMSSQDLKSAISDAAQSGDLNPNDAQQLIEKLSDIETLMSQFDFIQEQERRMISSVGSSFH